MAALTQAEVLRFLLERGGRVRNSELLGRFKPWLQSADPAEKGSKRDLFKKFINNVAAVREEEGVKFVVLKKKHWPLVPAGGEGGPESQPPQSLHLQPDNCPPEEALALGSGAEAAGSWHAPRGHLQAEDPLLNDSCDDQPPSSETREARESVFALVARIDPSGPVPNPRSLGNGEHSSREPIQKPYMLPIRCPHPPPVSARDFGILPERSTEKVHTVTKETLGSSLSSETLPPKSPHIKRRQFDESGSRSPHAKRVSKTLKVNEDSRYSEAVPLDTTEHEWLVKTTTGHWSHHLHGLLLSDIALAEKRDFMTGFTALHWAAKSGNTDMVSSIIDVARKGGGKLNVDVKSFGGYTPLHVAAMHGREDVIFMLVWQYNARVDLRDYSGKKPFQYLKTGSTLKARGALNDPHASSSTEQMLAKRNSKVASSILGSTSTFLGVLSDDMALQDLAKGLKKPASLNKLFNASTVSKKKSRLRGSFPSIASLPEEMDEEYAESTDRRRPLSEFFSH